MIQSASVVSSCGLPAGPLVFFTFANRAKVICNVAVVMYTGLLVTVFVFSFL